MTNDLWTMAGRAATVTGLTSVAVTGAKSIYEAHGTTHSSLVASGKKLEKVRSRLQQLSPQRRELLEIEIASQSGASLDDAPKSLGDIEKELEVLSDMHCRLSKRYEEETFGQRYLPYSRFRSRVLGLENKINALLYDTWKTTVPYVDDIEYGLSKESWQGVARRQACSKPSGTADLGRPHGAIAIQMTPRKDGVRNG